MRWVMTRCRRDSSSSVLMERINLLHGIDLEVAELYTSLDSESNKYVIAASPAIYLHSMNGEVKILSGRQAAGRQSEPRPPCFPRR
jgi:hypothetical protein